MITEDELAKNPPIQNPSPQTPGTPGVNPMVESFNQGTQGDRLILVMVGLPARGKTYVAKRVERYLTFFHGCPTKIFHFSDYKKEVLGAENDISSYDPNAIETPEKRKQIAEIALQDLVDFLSMEVISGRVAIYDAANVERETRKWIFQELKDRGKVIFVELVCFNESILEENIRRTKISTPDCINIEDAVQEYKSQIELRELVYETIDEKVENIPFIKIHESGQKIEISGVHGFLPSRIVQFLLNVRISGQSTFFFSRHGQSIYNSRKQIGGDSSLTELGKRYARSLSEFVEEKISKDEHGKTRKARLWTSSMKRTIETARFIKHSQMGKDWVQMRQRVWRGLDEIYAGVCDGMTYEEIKETYPLEYRARSENKLTYRYPRGESYLDIISRLDPLVHEMERIKEPLLVIGHQAILRVLICYFRGLPREECLKVDVPLHTVLKLTVDTYNCSVEEFKLLPDTEESNPPSH
eukprot:c21445_g1_i2.p1 GENE.c21445_g1_i2~~c21445_g1_i2.p1  ORF type:complete len:470 (+),score=103.24 c21445_g1_i2:40-1449(+)